MAETLRTLLDEVYAAERRYHAAVARYIYPGEVVHVTHGANEIRVLVQDVSAGGRVRVYNPSTGKEYEVDAPRLKEHDTREVARSDEGGSDHGE